MTTIYERVSQNKQKFSTSEYYNLINTINTYVDFYLNNKFIDVVIDKSKVLYSKSRENIYIYLLDVDRTKRNILNNKLITFQSSIEKVLSNAGIEI